MECGVCLDIIKKDGRQVVPSCGHAIHFECCYGLLCVGSDVMKGERITFRHCVCPMCRGWLVLSEMRALEGTTETQERSEEMRKILREGEELMKQIGAFVV